MMANILESAHETADLAFVEYCQKIANRIIAQAQISLGIDEADIASCVNGNGDVASKRKHLEKIFGALCKSMDKRHAEEDAVTRHLAQQLHALSDERYDDAVGHTSTWSIDNLSDDAKQQAMPLVLKLTAQRSRQLDVANGQLNMLEHSVEFRRQGQMIYRDGMQNLAALADSQKDWLDAANEALSAPNDDATARSDSALRKANEKVARLEKEVSETSGRVVQLEKEASGTSERVAQAVCDMQKSVYKKDDPGGAAANCADCQALKAKLDDVEKTLVALVTENSKLLDDKKTLLADRERDKDDMNTHTKQMAKLREENAAEKPKKRNK